MRVVHIEDAKPFWSLNDSDEEQVAKAVCGAACVVDRDGRSPPDFDFVLSSYSERATCEECKRRHSANVAVKNAKVEV